MTPSGPNSHVRRDSVASMQSEISSSGYPQSRNYSQQGRSRGHPNNYHNQGYQGHQGYHNGQRPNGSRGYPPSFAHQAHRGTRSPAPSQAMPNPAQMQGAYGYNAMGYPYGIDPAYQQWYGQNMPMAYAPSASPQPPHRTPSSNFNPMMNQFVGSPALQISRTPSQISEHRPTSSLAYSTPVAGPNTTVPAVSSQNPNKPNPQTLPFKIPPKSKGLIIVDPNTGKEIAKPTKPVAAPTPSPEQKASPAKSMTSTPEPTVSRPRTDSNVKTAQEKMDEMKAAVQRKLKEEVGDASANTTEPAESVESDSESSLVEEKATVVSKGDSEDQSIKSSDEAGTEKQAKSAPETYEQDVEETEDERIERQIREIEEAERLEEERQQKYETEKAERLKTEKASYALSAAGLAEAKALKDAEAEAERIEEARAAKVEKDRAQEEAHQSAEALAESERVEDEFREKSPDESGLNTPAESEVSHLTTAANLVSGLRRLVSSPGTGASTPGSEDSTGLPKSAMKRTAGLSRIETATSSAPSPQQQALKAAQIIKDFSSITYPDSIKPPGDQHMVGSSALSYRYDTDFLLQFRSVCTSKPTPDWDKQLKEAMGEGGDSARTPANRGGHPISSRQTSHRGNNPFQGGAMGAFGQANRPLAPGTTSEERFAISNNRPAARPGMGTPGVSFVAMPRGGASGPVSRNPSTSSFGMGAGITPPSPRRGHTGRHDSNRNPSRGSRKQDDKEAKSMPITAGQDLTPLVPSSTGWKPRSVGAAAQMTGPAPGDNGLLDPLTVQRKVKSNLNKMTPENFEKISGQILEIAAQSKHEHDGRTLRQVIQLTFEKATDEAHWAPMYAQFALKMLRIDPGIQDEGVKDKDGNPLKGGPLFRKYLLSRCQAEFEKGWKVDLPEKAPGQSDEAVMLSDEYYIAAAAKRRGLGLIRFIGEMFKLGMLSPRIMHECLRRLLDFEGLPDEAEIESLCNLLKTVGDALDTDEKSKAMMDRYFDRIENIKDLPELPSRLYYMLLDILDLRKKGWQGKDTNKGPKTIQAIRVEVSSSIPLLMADPQYDSHFANKHSLHRPRSKRERRKPRRCDRTHRSETTVEMADDSGVQVDSRVHLR